jgi:hypothetical protein
LSEFLIKSHRDLLKEIIESLCAGNKPLELMKQFERECDSISPDDLSTLFEQLDAQAIDFRNNDELIRFFEQVVEEKITTSELNRFPMGHPARVYLEENILLRAWIKNIWQFKPSEHLDNFAMLFDDIAKVELHYQRKENQLFPCLEKHGWDSPSKNMWALHDDIRALLKEVRQAIEQGDTELAEQKAPYLFSELERMMQIEEQRLLPRAMELLDDEDWLDMREGDREIGWMLDQEPAPFPVHADTDYSQEEDVATQAVVNVCPFGADRLDKEIADKVQAASSEVYEHPSQVKRKKKLPFDTTGMHHYDEGYMTPEQVNLIFRTLPLDITYVDENGKVLFYNRGQERLFPRSAGIIGREVHLCHPPKSVDMVLRIVEEFKKGTRDVADFRINMKGRFVMIRYFAVRDEQRNYRGVMEMSQDITDIQTLEGEQRLLDWA